MGGPHAGGGGTYEDPGTETVGQGHREIARVKKWPIGKVRINDLRSIPARSLVSTSHSAQRERIDRQGAAHLKVTSIKISRATRIHIVAVNDR